MRGRAPAGTGGLSNVAASPLSATSCGAAHEINSHQNTLPSPAVLSTPSTPPISSASRLVTTRPMPVPATPPASCPRRLNGWNSCATFSGDNPTPVSLTLMRVSPGVLVVQSTTTVPRSLLYLIALESRLMTICFNRVRSALTNNGLSNRGKATLMLAGGLIHLLLIIAVISLVMHFLQGP